MIDESLVRRRKSYGFWKEFLDWADHPRTKEEIAFKFHEILDDKRAYGYASQAHKSAESLRQVILDSE